MHKEKVPPGNNDTMIDRTAPRVAVMVVNPYLLHVYWQISERDRENNRDILDKSGAKSRPVLRFYDITCILFDGTNAHRIFDVGVDLRTMNWNVPIWKADKSYVVDLGYKASDGGFYPIARSNVINVPPVDPSHRLAESCLRVEDGRIKSLVPARLVDVPPGMPLGELRPDNACGMEKRIEEVPTGKAEMEAPHSAQANHTEQSDSVPCYVPQVEQTTAEDVGPKIYASNGTNAGHAPKAAVRKRSIDLVRHTLEKFSFGASSPTQGTDS